jgi:solute carrier family 25 phosphate transporter 3
LWKEQGLPGLWKGWGGKLCGYGGQGACKFGFYEYFKKAYSDAAGPAYTDTHRTLIYMASSVSVEAIADVVLCPFEAVKVRVQTHPAFAKGLADGFPKLYRTEGFKG